eukprot:3526143-Ditylum_brightwellii.AAC.1
MGNIDVNDQLRNYCRLDNWVCKTKWRWSIFFCGFVILPVNLYVAYVKYMRQMGIPDRDIMSQYEFGRLIALSHLDPNTHWTLIPSRSVINQTCANIQVARCSARVDLECRCSEDDTSSTRGSTTPPCPICPFKTGGLAAHASSTTGQQVKSAMTKLLFGEEWAEMAIRRPRRMKRGGSQKGCRN